jgi:plasmid maintenance system antidote protein VapI
MLLASYLSERRITDAEFAKSVGIGRSMITKLRHRSAKPSFDTALRIQRVTEGLVRVEDLEPTAEDADREAVE